MNVDNLKKLAAEKAVDELKSGMVIGLGTGSTFYFALLKIAELVKNSSLRDVKFIASSKRTEKLAQEYGLDLTNLNENPIIDITIDGADEVDTELNVIKGGGGALLREKVLAQASKQFIVIVDETKLSKNLGINFALPIEVLKYCVESEKKYIELLGASVNVRKENDDFYVTDEGNYIIDAKFEKIQNVKELSDKLNDRAGIVGHGLFVGLAQYVFVAKNSTKEVEILNSKK